MWGAPKCGGPGAQAPVAPPLIRRCMHEILSVMSLIERQRCRCGFSCSKFQTIYYLCCR